MDDSAAACAADRGPPAGGVHDAADRQGPVRWRSGRLHRGGRPLCCRGRRRVDRGGLRDAAAGAEYRTRARAGRPACRREPAGQPRFAPDIQRRRSDGPVCAGRGGGRSKLPPAPADPRADRDTRLRRGVGWRHAAPYHAYRQSGAASIPHTACAPDAACRIPGHRDLPGHRRRLRPEDPGLPRGAHGRGARARARPVRWREDRAENLIAACHAREDTARTRAAVDRDGRIRALELTIVEDFGGYCFYPANYLARVVAMILTGPYKISDYAFDVRVVLTNKCGNGPMRAPMAMTSWIMDGTIEAIARRLDLDPIEVRRVNMVHAADLPYRMPTGEVLDEVTPRETLEHALAAFNVEAFRAQQRAERARGIHRGLGVCCVVESTTYGSAFYKAAGIPGSGHESGWVKIEPSGAVNASVGLMASGQGYETVFAQVVADALGIDPDQVRIQLGNTDIAPYGMGTRGARGGTAGGSALLIAARALREKVLAVAAAMLGLNTFGELRLRNGRIERCLAGEWTDAGIALAEVAHTAYLDPLRLPERMEPGLEAHHAYDPPPMTYSNATHLCEALVDPRTGRVTLERYL